MRSREGLILLVLALVAAAGSSRAQEGYDSYEMQYGRAVDVALDTLLQMPEPYEGRAVRTTGRLEWLQSPRSRYYALGSFVDRAIIVPFPQTRGPFESDSHRWLGRDIEITGVVSTGQDPERGTTTVIISFWSYFGPPDEEKGPRVPSPEATLEELLTRPGQRDGQRVRVVGQFRGANLYGDLPSASRRRSADWVLKNDLFAVWVTGKKPQGSGWKLDAKLRRDSGKWLEVQGRVRTIRGVVYIEATDIALTTAPSPTAEAKAPERPPPPPPKPPVIVFSLPLDGERDVPPSSVFKVQFSKDMDVESFGGRVVLRYAGRPRPGDRPLDAVTVQYDGGRRALTVDPGDLLRQGRVVELLLLPGIVDLDGLPLESRPGHDPGGAAETLRFRVASGFVSGVSP